MPIERQPFPPGFNVLPLDKKLSFAVKAWNDDEYLNNIIAWLKDTGRDHNQTEDETIILALNYKVDRLVEKGIQLPPPFNLNYFMYSSSFIDYLEKYSEFPSREATEVEKRYILSTRIGYSSYVDRDVNAIIVHNLLPRLENNTNNNNILNNLQKLEEDTIRRLLQYTYTRGDLNEIGIQQLLTLFARKLQGWQTERDEFSRRFPRSANLPVHKFNKGIKAYTVAKDFLTELLRNEARGIHTAIETAEPGSLLYRLPMNLAPTITKFATGLNYNKYRGGKRSKRAKRSKSKRRNTRKY